MGQGPAHTSVNLVGERSDGAGAPQGGDPLLPAKQPSSEHVDANDKLAPQPRNFVAAQVGPGPSGGGVNESTPKPPTEPSARTNGPGPRSKTHTRERIFTLLTAIYPHAHKQKRLFVPEASPPPTPSNVGNQNAILIKEAIKLQIPVIGILDSDSNPFGISYPIPGNDDSSDAISVYTTLPLHACTQSEKTQIQDIGVS